MQDRIQLHKMICESTHQLYSDKNDDYGDSFRTTRKKYGNTAILIRLTDKFLRLEKLLTSDTPERVKDERIEDTLQDLANYALMEIVERKTGGE